MNVTLPISATGPAHSTSPAPPANSSLADFLFADSSAGSPSDFRTIAATLFDVEGLSATSARSSAKSVVAEKKAAADPLEDKVGTRKETTDPASSGLHPESIVSPQNVPTPLIQVPNQVESTDGTLAAQGRSSVRDDLAHSRLTALGEKARIGGDEPDIQVVPLDECVSPSSFRENSVPLLQPHATVNDPNLENHPKEQKEPAASTTSLQANGSTRKKDVESARPVADRFQPPVDPRLANQSAPATTYTNQTTRTTVPSVGISTEKPLGSAPTDDTPQSQPVEPTSDAAATQVLDNVAATKAGLQPELAKPGAVTESRSASRRNALGTSAKTKSRDIKDSRLTSAQSGKGFPRFALARSSRRSRQTGGSEALRRRTIFSKPDRRRRTRRNSPNIRVVAGNSQTRSGHESVRISGGDAEPGVRHYRHSNFDRAPHVQCPDFRRAHRRGQISDRPVTRPLPPAGRPAGRGRKHRHSWAKPGNVVRPGPRCTAPRLAATGPQRREIECRTASLGNNRRHRLCRQIGHSYLAVNNRNRKSVKGTQR